MDILVIFQVLHENQEVLFFGKVFVIKGPSKS